MKLFGLIGYPITHSFSKKYFTDKFSIQGITDCRYDLYPIESVDLLPKLIRELPDLKGLNVTIPHKEVVMPLMHRLDPSAEKVGAVNVIKLEGKNLVGYNSDYYGFKNSLESIPEISNCKKAVVLGTGGASKAVIAAISDLGLQLQLVSRTAKSKAITYDDPQLNKIISEADLIVNTTPLGMYPDIESFPKLPYHKIKNGCIAFDLVYNPDLTQFLRRTKSNGAIIKNGLEMLRLQAEKSWEIWTA